MNDNNLNAYISTQGDMSVGVRPFSTIIDLDLELNDVDDIEREGIREILNETLSEIWGEDATTVFSDECGECNRRLDNCKCYR